MELMFLHIRVSALNCLPGCIQSFAPGVPVSMVAQGRECRIHLFIKTPSYSGNVNLIFQRNNSKLRVALAAVSPFILVSLESGYLDNSQQLAFSRRGSHPDSAQKYCRRRPSDKVPEKAPNASSCGTTIQTGGLCFTPRLDRAWSRAFNYR